MQNKLKDMESRVSALEKNLLNLSYMLFAEKRSSANNTPGYRFEKDINSKQISFAVDEKIYVESFAVMNMADKEIEIRNLKINNKILPYDIGTLIEHIVETEKSDEMRTKLIFEFIRDNTNWDYPKNLSDEYSEPFNLLYHSGFGLCDDQAKCFVSMLNEIGIMARLISIGPPGLHIVSEVFYNNKWHLFDPDGGNYFGDEAYSLEELTGNLSLVDDYYANRYPAERLKSQFVMTKNQKEIPIDFLDYEESFISIKLLPLMEFSYSRKPDIPLGLNGYRGFDPKKVTYGEYRNSKELAGEQRINLESPFPIVYAKFDIDSREIEYSLNKNRFQKKFVDENRLEIFKDIDEEFDSNALMFNKDEKLYSIRAAGNIRSYSVIVQINAAAFPMPASGANDLSFDSSEDNPDLRIRIEGRIAE